jgi:ferredoxin
MAIRIVLQLLVLCAFILFSNKLSANNAQHGIEKQNPVLSDDASKEFAQKATDDEFEVFEQPATDDEFETFTQGGTVDEFEAFDSAGNEDEFAAFDGGSESKDHTSCGDCGEKKKDSQLWWVIAALGATVAAGIMVRFKSTRNLRGFSLLASMLILGFYVGGCPCPIMSLQHVIFAGIGIETKWTGMIWFIGLIPVSYVFGKVWCGWICHLGAVQEFLYLPGKIKILQSEKAQLIMRWIRIVLLIALVIQILITNTNLFKTIDPFKVAFNLRSPNLIGWILLGLILLSSLFMFRPFCKSACPIGLILGWVGKLPGSSILAPSNKCSGCKICDRSCKINAITCGGKESRLDNQECIACGDCIGDCKTGSMLFVRNTKNHASISICKRA